jgi:hypothetical protein
VWLYKVLVCLCCLTLHPSGYKCTRLSYQNCSHVIASPGEVQVRSFNFQVRTNDSLWFLPGLSLPHRNKLESPDSPSIYCSLTETTNSRLVEIFLLLLDSGYVHYFLLNGSATTITCPCTPLTTQKPWLVHPCMESELFRKGWRQ